MSCCGGNCGCGADCKCGNGCGGCGMYPDLSYSEVTSAVPRIVILGVSPQKEKIEESGAVIGSAENGCKCGPNCSCNPCTCK